MKKSLRCSMFFLVLLALSAELSAADFPLVRNGRSAAVIVKPSSVPENFDQDVAFFNKELKQCTGAVLPVTGQIQGKSNKIIFQIEKKSVREDDAFTIDFPNHDTMRITCSPLSLRWAFNHILEQNLGIRWLLPPSKKLGSDNNHYPVLKDAVVPMKTFADKPVAVFNRLGSHRGGAFLIHWNQKTAFNGVHMMMVDVYSVYKYGPDQSWPDAIVPTGIDGKKRVPQKMTNLPKNHFRARKLLNTGWQPCWSHPESARIAARDILETLAKNPDKKFINLDINDNGGCCRCTRCRAAVGNRVNSIRMPDYSPVYWKWVNDIAVEVSKKYPDVIFNAIAYREVLTPPAFQLHKNVLPRICLELTTLDDPVTGAKKIKIFDEWSKKASQLDLYDYVHGVDFFLIPRIYFHSHSKLLTELIKNQNLRSAYFESNAETAFQGPQQQLMLKLLWNPNLDVDKFLDDWCEAAVGKKAAQYLRKYYQFWEDYCNGPELRKTMWYKSVGNTYMTLGEHNSHTFALQKGDLAKLRSLMDNMVKNAETKAQKKRAAALMECFEYTELACTAAFSEYFPADGNIRSAKDALELLKAAPKGFQAVKKYLKHPFIKIAVDKGQMLEPAAVSAFGQVLPFVKDPAVNAELKKLSADPSIPTSLRAQIMIWLGAKPKNLIENGSFEQPAPLPRWGGHNPKRDTGHASDGKYALLLSNGFYMYHIPVKTGKTYLFLCDLFMEKGSGEGRFTYKFGFSTAQKIAMLWNSYKYLVLTPGTWNTFSSVMYIPNTFGKENQKVVYASIPLTLSKYEHDEFVWVDNLRLYCLDDLITKKENEKMKLSGMIMVAAAAAAVNAAEMNVNGDFSKAAIGAEHPARWSVNATAAKGKAVVDKEVKDTLPVFHITADKKKVSAFCKNKIAVKTGDTLKITVKASGKGKFQIACYTYGANNISIGKQSAAVQALKDGMNDYTGMITIKPDQKGEIKHVLAVITVLPGADISIRSVKVELLSAK